MWILLLFFVACGEDKGPVVSHGGMFPSKNVCMAHFKTRNDKSLVGGKCVKVSLD